MTKALKNRTEEVPLLRAGSIVSSFTGAFGASLRETRLTAILGYLIALKPKVFCRAFGITGTVESVSLEARHKQDRSDILIKSTDGLAVVEAKLGATDPFKQARQYNAKWLVLLTQYMPSPNQKDILGVRYFRWHEIAGLIQRNNIDFTKGAARFVSEDLIKYMKEHNMIQDDQDEIYVRDIDDNETADFFLKGHIYNCGSKGGDRVTKAHYFAPYFCRNVSNSHPGLQEGISYIAKIISVQFVETREDFMKIAREFMANSKFKGDRHSVKGFKEWFFARNHKVRIIFLSAPRFAFNPPIKKRYLQKRSWTIQRNYWAFDELYQAWSGREMF